MKNTFELSDLSEVTATDSEINKEILSRTLPEQWGKIELGRICYQVSNTSKADHYDLKSDGAVTAFIAGIKCKKNIQLCVYRESGCLISEDGQHLKLDSDIIMLWARAIFTKMPGVDEKTPPNIPSFDKAKYRYPTSKRPLNNNNNKSNEVDSTSIFTNSYSNSISTTAILLAHIFPKGPPTGKRFVIKSSLDIDGENYLPVQAISKLFADEHVNIWIDLEDIDIKFDELFD
ncbi:31007_t:CDS:2 [Gigaspora margarita]|uniref:31007_t:CDS:1 n=1 Tax=Gigaspora margarita TaxID=4874 RepID=A0ABN7W629_GIGMA|nr:31007_t:CDS:2 [Gigaspora margarita]